MKKESLETPRTSEGLREALFSELDLVRNGESNPQRAHALCRLTSEIIKASQLEIEFYKQITRQRKAGDIPQTVLTLVGNENQ